MSTRPFESLEYKMPEELLNVAIQEGDIEAVKEHIMKANTKHPLFMGGKLLLRACNKADCSVEIVRELLEVGCPVNQKDNTMYQDTPLHMVAKRGHLDVMRLLLEFGADSKLTNRFGQTPLHRAAQMGNTEAVALLIREGAVLDYKDCGECTPFFHAVSAGHSHTVAYMIRVGANVDTLNDELLSPLDQALTYNYRDIISLLLKGGCEINKALGYIYYRGHYCNSVLYPLVADGDTTNIQLMVDCGYRFGDSGIRHMISYPGLYPANGNVAEVLKEMTMQPKSLYRWCRVVIRRILTDTRHSHGLSLEHGIDRLNTLPNKLKDYLAFRDS